MSTSTEQATPQLSSPPRRELELMFAARGFEQLEIQTRGGSGFLVRAYRS
jgi:hypothetical protein